MDRQRNDLLGRSQRRRRPIEHRRIYNPGTNSWTGTSVTGAPTGRFFPTAVWTDSEMIVWGGHDDSGNNLDTGGRYCAQPSATPILTPRLAPSPMPRPDSTPPALITQMIPKLRREIGYLF